MKKNNIFRNEFLDQTVTHYWMYRYIPYESEEDSVDKQISVALGILKNYKECEIDSDLDEAVAIIEKEVTKGLNIILNELMTESPEWVVVAVPRSKANFAENQLYLNKKAISNAVSRYPVENGTEFIKRINDTKTTHLMKTKYGDLNKTGKEPYPGITRDTCNLNGNVRGKNVILIDDIYTAGVNVDEDCIQYLFDNDAKNVVLYTVCKTNKNH